MSKKNIGRIALFAAAILWGVSFVAMKSVLTNIPTLYVLAIRFCGAALILLPACARKLKEIDRQHIFFSVTLGVVLFLAYVFQTYGLRLTTPGKNAFLTSAYCIIVPFLYWALSAAGSAYRKRIRKGPGGAERPIRKPDKFNVAAAAVCVAGIGLISLENDFSIGAGDALTIACGFFFAIQIVVISGAVENRDPILVAMLQFAAAGVITLVCAFIFEAPPTTVTASDIWIMAFLTVVSTAVCIVLQIIGQKYTPPSQAAVILTLESVFGAVSSAIIFHEVMTLRLVAGFALTFAAVIISEVKPRFSRRRTS